MDLHFPAKCNGFSNDHEAATNHLTPVEFDEKTFNRMLTLERKRTERTKRPFMLLLLSLEGLAADESGNGPRKKVLPCVASAIRDVDVLGWYKEESVLGVIFAEIGNTGPAVNCILDRVSLCLAGSLDADEVKKIETSVHFFPEKYGHFDTPTDLTLYPDIQKTRSFRKASLILKRLIDVVGSLVALIAICPVFLVIAALIKLTSDGPVLFRQKRMGQYGKPFTFLKFRSMFVNNDSAIHQEYVKNLIASSDSATCNGGSREGQVFKIQNDPRVTPIGRILRRTSLDELPQFINVLKGEMSLVGPRPPIPYEFENYEIWHRRRVVDMKPGITGIWQVEGRSSTTFNEMVRLDIYYLSNWSIWLDLKLLFMTPWVVFTSKGAY
jgi:lipopolysaccharide/colanic/teichoic acid biosynthesis glycosyltransferase